MLTKGDKVAMDNKHHVPVKYHGKEFIGTAVPQKIGGAMYIWLSACSGCHAGDGLPKVGGKDA